MADAPKVPEFRIFLDPGHGGKPEAGGTRGGAHFDPTKKRFLNVYSYGTEYRAKGGIVISEQQLVLKLAKMVRERLLWTRTDEGWAKFSTLLSRFGSVLPPFDRVRFQVALSRENDYLSHPQAGARDINKFFRFFDSPAKLPWKDGDPMIEGRLSAAARFAPDLLVSLHIDGSQNKAQRGMSALFVPSHQDFLMVRDVILKKKAVTSVPKLLRRYWKYSGRKKTKFGWSMNDTWTYFTGFRSDPTGRSPNLKSDIGQRWEHLTWAYAAAKEGPRRQDLVAEFQGPFWDRERSPQEAARRAGGPEGIGGDNLYAGQELLRWVRLAMWADYKQSGGGWAEGLTPKQLLPPLEKPTGSDWAMPLHTNAVAPFLELGQLWNWKDRFLLTKKMPAVADGLAVGIYALASGFVAPPVEGVEAPKGQAIDWSRYRMPDGTTWAAQAIPRPAGADPARTEKATE